MGSDYKEYEKDRHVTHIWHDTIMKESIVTHRGTKVEIVDRPTWGLTCYMDNCIQSCIFDEKIYHEALVHPVMSDSVKNVCIIGGGEGATAREVLKWPVDNVDMYEWDRDVVELFKRYPEWSTCWEDPRLHIFYDDIFEIDYIKKYDVIIVDLFEQDVDQMNKLLKMLLKWSNTIIMYAGMSYPGINQEYSKENQSVYKVYVPSFFGEAVFLLMR